jgi:hypothetical protein
MRRIPFLGQRSRRTIYLRLLFVVGDFADLYFAIAYAPSRSRPCPARARSDTKDTDGRVSHFLLIAPPPVATLRGALQWRGYTQDTDENGEYLQNQIPPMQIGRCSPPLDA